MMPNIVQQQQMTDENTRYVSDIERARRDAQSLSTDYLRGYIKSYETNRGVITKIGEALGFRKPPIIVGFKRTLESRTSSK